MRAPAPRFGLAVDRQMVGASLREKAKAGSPVTSSELIVDYCRHAHEYYRKRGIVSREAGMAMPCGSYGVTTEQPSPRMISDQSCPMNCGKG
jgi:hypothetical protein